MGLEILCRCNPGTINPESIGGTGRPELTASEVAAILHSEPNGVYYMGMYAIAGQYSETKVSGYLYDQIKDGKIRVKPKREEDQGRPIYSRMAILAVHEVVTENQCIACNGRGWADQTRQCVTCNGTAKLVPTDQWKAEQCYAFDWAYWEPCYNHLWGVANDWKTFAIRKINAEMG